jgi:hypothetical protein
MSTIPASSTIVPANFVPSAAYAPPTAPAVHRFTVDEYFRLFESGFLKETDRVELIEGIICEMMNPIGSQHGMVVELTRKVWDRLDLEGYSVWSQQTMKTHNSAPLPDVYIARGDHRDYEERHPGPTDLALVIEVADTSLRFDRTEKQRMYASAGAVEYWIVNLPERVLEIYRKPLPASNDQPARYESMETFDSQQTIDLMLDGLKVGTLPVRKILPKA